MLNRLLLIGMIGALSLFVCNCGRPPLANRYSSIEEQVDDACENVRVSGFSLPAIDPEKPTTISGLDGRGQAALLAELSKKVDDPVAFVHLAASPLAPPKTAAPVQDNTRFRRRIILSLENRSFGPADRVAFARIGLDLPKEGGYEFVGWNKLQTEFAQVDVATLKQDEKSSRSLDAKLGGSYSGVSAELVPKVSAESAFSQEVALRQRYVALTGTIASKNTSILQQSVSGVDLTGNVVFDLELKASEHALSPITVAMVSNLFDKEGKSTPQERVQLAFKQVRIADADAAPVEADITLSYRMRKVTRGDESVMEGDDHVVFASAEGCRADAPLVLLTKDDLKFTTWELMSADGMLVVAVDRVSGKAERSHPVSLDLETSGAAYELLSWMMSSSGGALRLASRNLYLCPYSDLTEDACTPLSAAAARRLTAGDVNWNWTSEPAPRPPVTPAS